MKQVSIYKLINLAGRESKFFKIWGSIYEIENEYYSFIRDLRYFDYSSPYIYMGLLDPDHLTDSHLTNTPLDRKINLKKL